MYEDIVPCPDKKPIITFVTRHLVTRPCTLKSNIEHVRVQTNQNYQHMFIVDDCKPERRGMHWANAQIGVNKERVKGEFVMIYDDDGILVDDTFVEQLAQLVDTDIRIVCIRSRQRNRVYPSDSIWNKEIIPRFGIIDSPSTIVRNELFQKHADKYDMRKGGDYNFIQACFREVMKDSFSKIKWIDKIIAHTSGQHKGIPEREGKAL